MWRAEARGVWEVHGEGQGGREVLSEECGRHVGRGGILLSARGVQDGKRQQERCILLRQRGVWRG